MIDDRIEAFFLNRQRAPLLLELPSASIQFGCKPDLGFQMLIQ